MSSSGREGPADFLLDNLRELKKKQRLIEANIRFMEKQYPKSALVIRKLHEELSHVNGAIASKELELKNLGYR